MIVTLKELIEQKIIYGFNFCEILWAIDKLPSLRLIKERIVIQYKEKITACLTGSYSDIGVFVLSRYYEHLTFCASNRFYDSREREEWENEVGIFEAGVYKILEMGGEE